MSKIDDIVHELAEIDDALRQLPPEAREERAELRTRRLELRSQAAGLTAKPEAPDEPTKAPSSWAKMGVSVLVVVLALVVGGILALGVLLADFDCSGGVLGEGCGGANPTGALATVLIVGAVMVAVLWVIWHDKRA